jgi:membrane protease YdiL (CAAX protease family)
MVSPHNRIAPELRPARAKSDIEAMQENPIPLLLMIAAGLYFMSMWLSDWRANARGRTEASNPLPGATSAPVRALIIASAGAAIIVALETWGEIHLGLSEDQSKMTVLFGLYTLVAAFVEEIIFRGYLVVEKRGRMALLAGIFGASFLFALIHPFLWEWDDGGFAFTLTAKGWFSFVAVFAASLWFYACRFSSWNPNRSLLPCFAAHLTKNAAVFSIKGAQGFVSGLW